jgi:hypothetical protein
MARLVGRRSGPRYSGVVEMMFRTGLLTDEDVGFLLTRGHHLGRVPKGGMCRCRTKSAADGVGLRIAISIARGPVVHQDGDVSVAIRRLISLFAITTGSRSPRRSFFDHLWSCFLEKDVNVEVEVWAMAGQGFKGPIVDLLGVDFNALG